MVTTVKNPVDLKRLPVNAEEHVFERWNVKYKQSHILSSKCSNSPECDNDSGSSCLFCM